MVPITPLALAHPPHRSRAYDAAHSTKGAAEGVDTGIFVSDDAFLVHGFGLLSCGLEEDCGSPVEFLEFLWVDFGHLEDGDANTDDEEADDEGEEACYAGVEAFE